MIRSTKVLSVDFLTEFLDAYEYCEDAKASFTKDLKALIACDSAREKINEELGSYVDKDFDFVASLEAVKPCFSEAGVGEYQGSFIFVAHLSSTMRELFAKYGIDDAIWFDTMRDLWYKANECILIHKVWGTFVATWYRHFFAIRLVAFGRLQFEEKPFGRVATIKGVVMDENTPVLSVHIPTTGTPLDRASFSESYNRAIKFFKDRYFGGEYAKFICSSWLLSPQHKEMLKPDSNILDFASDFELIHVSYNEDYKGAWRIFDRSIDMNDLASLPEDNSLRRGYKKLMLEGKKTASGFGVYIPEA